MSDTCHSVLLSHTSQRKRISNQRITPGWTFQCSEADPSQPHLTQGTAANFGSQLLVSPAARHCPLSSCPKYKPPALPMPGLCSCRPMAAPRGSPMVVSLPSTRCWKSLRSLPSQTLLWLYHLIQLKTNTVKGKKAPSWMNSLLCFTLLHEHMCPGLGHASDGGEDSLPSRKALEQSQVHPCSEVDTSDPRSKACKQNQLVQTHLTPNNSWGTQGTVVFITRGSQAPSGPRSQASDHSSAEP